MALKEDYKDAVFAGLRKYKMLDNGDGTVSPVDMTEYETAGDKFGAKDVNAITKTVNATGEIITDDNDEFKPNQKYEIGRIVIYDNKTWRFKVDHEPGEWDERQVERTNILAVIAEQNKNFGNLTFAQDADGNWGYKVGGADPVIPFKQGGVKLLTSITGDGAINITSYVTTDYKKLTVDNFIVESYYFPKAQTVNTSGGNRSAGAALGATLSKSYDQSTEILTVSGLSQLACLMDNTTNVRASVIQKFSAKIYMVN